MKRTLNTTTNRSKNKKNGERCTHNYGYTITTPSGNTIHRVVDRDDYRRNLVTNCVTYFNSSLVDSHLYAFDALSRPTARTTGTTGVSPVDATFTYNNRSEVVSAAIGTNLFEHDYDAIGNHLLFGDNALTNTYTHNNLNQITALLCASAPPRELIHNLDGGLSSDGAWSYAYDAEDQLLYVTSSSLTNGAIRVLNTYDYRHRRTSKTVQRLNSTIPPPPSPPIGVEEWQTIETRTFVYDDWNLIYETIYSIDGGITNTVEVQYFWGLDLSDSRQGAGGVGGLLAVSRNGQFYFPAYDNNGNVTQYIDESGIVVAAYEYDDFGRITSQSGPLADIFCHRFSTKHYDPETKLANYSFRFYSPGFRIWISRDPLEEEGSVNMTSFVGNNALIGIDPLGAAVKITANPTPIRKSSITYREGFRTYSIRAITRYSDVLKFSCDRWCVMHVSGEMRLWIELLDENSPKWYDRLSQYRGSSEEREDMRTLSHERDHYQTWKALFDFAKTANLLDGRKFVDCQARAARYNAAYRKYRAITAKHSLKFDNGGWNMGGQYSRHPLDTSKFKWE